VGYNRSLEEIKSSDTVKKQLAKEKGITLIPIPCWWDGTKSRYLHFFLLDAASSLLAKLSLIYSMKTTA